MVIFTEIFEKGFTRGTLNYLEGSHGKGAPDGVGGTLKRMAIRLVSQGVDIPTALSVYQALSEEHSKVKLFGASCGGCYERNVS